MATNYTSRKSKVFSAKLFKDSFSQDVSNKIGYVFVSKALEYPDENVASEIADTPETENSVWDNMLGAKKVVSGDVEFVIPRYDWEANTIYKQYDDTKTLDYLLTVTEDIANNKTYLPMYVMNSSGDVYKCICNNGNRESIAEPTGTYTENDGFIIQEDTNNNSFYIWKYMYNVKMSNKFLTDSWIPVPYEYNEIIATDYNLNTSNFVDGGLHKIIMVNKGSGYAHTTLNVSPFSSDATVLSITDDIFLPTSNVKVNMLVTGTGFLQGTYIKSLDSSFNTIELSTPTISSGGGLSNSISILTRVEVVGDGTDTVCAVRLANTTIDKIDVTGPGTGFTKANVLIYGSGTGASARAVIPPLFGHGNRPAFELGASNIMITQTIGEVDSSENGKIPVDTSFRQYGLLVNPYKYGESVQLVEANTESVVSQTTDVTLISGTTYSIGERVYQGTSDRPNFYGYVISQSSDSTVLRLTNVYGTIVLGTVLVGETSGISRPTVSIKYPDLRPYAGDILYAKNILKVERSEGQAEEIKLVFQF